MPLLFALESLSHHRLTVDTEFCRLVHRRDFDQVVLRSRKDDHVRLITMNRSDAQQGYQYLQLDETLEDSAVETDADVEEMLKVLKSSRLKRAERI